MICELPMVHLYRIQFDGRYDYVEAPDLNAAIAAWQQEYFLLLEGAEPPQPESVELLESEAGDPSRQVRRHGRAGGTMTNGGEYQITVKQSRAELLLFMVAAIAIVTGCISVPVLFVYALMGVMQ